MHQVFQPASLGSLDLKNRLINSATFECMADENGGVTDRLISGLIAFQLAHGGRQSPKNVIGQAPLAPHGFGRDPASMNKPTAATEAACVSCNKCFAAVFNGLPLRCYADGLP